MRNRPSSTATRPSETSALRRDEPRGWRVLTGLLGELFWAPRLLTMFSLQQQAKHRLAHADQAPRGHHEREGPREIG